jgi:hypothetical protein
MIFIQNPRLSNIFCFRPNYYWTFNYFIDICFRDFNLILQLFHQETTLLFNGIVIYNFKTAVCIIRLHRPKLIHIFLYFYRNRFCFCLRIKRRTMTIFMVTLFIIISMVVGVLIVYLTSLKSSKLCSWIFRKRLFKISYYKTENSFFYFKSYAFE